MRGRRSFEWRGRFGPFELLLSEHTFLPSGVSMLLARALEVKSGETVIDMGCGSGILFIVAAKSGAGQIFGVDTAPDVVEVATLNGERQGVAEVTTFYQGDLFDSLPDDLRADVIIGDVSGIPDSFAKISGWFPSGIGGGPWGSELPARMLRVALRWLRPQGRLFLPTGSLQDEDAILEVARSLFDKLTEVVERCFPVPTDLAETAELHQLVRNKIVRLTSRGSRFIWSARIWKCVLGEA